MKRPRNSIIRSLAQGDFAQWLPLWEGYNRFYGRDALPEEITRTTWSRFLDEGEPVYALVAERDGAAGWVGALSFSSQHDSD